MYDRAVHRAAALALSSHAGAAASAEDAGLAVSDDEPDQNELVETWGQHKFWARPPRRVQIGKGNEVIGPSDFRGPDCGGLGQVFKSNSESNTISKRQNEN